MRAGNKLNPLNDREQTRVIQWIREMAALHDDVIRVELQTFPPGAFASVVLHILNRKAARGDALPGTSGPCTQKDSPPHMERSVRKNEPGSEEDDTDDDDDDDDSVDSSEDGDGGSRSTEQKKGGEDTKRQKGTDDDAESESDIDARDVHATLVNLARTPNPSTTNGLPAGVKRARFAADGGGPRYGEPASKRRAATGAGPSPVRAGSRARVPSPSPSPRATSRGASSPRTNNPSSARKAQQKEEKGIMKRWNEHRDPDRLLKQVKAVLDDLKKHLGRDEQVQLPSVVPFEKEPLSGCTPEALAKRIAIDALACHRAGRLTIRSYFALGRVLVAAFRAVRDQKDGPTWKEWLTANLGVSEKYAGKLRNLYTLLGPYPLFQFLAVPLTRLADDMVAIHFALHQDTDSWQREARFWEAPRWKAPGRLMSPFYSYPRVSSDLQDAIAQHPEYVDP